MSEKSQKLFRLDGRIAIVTGSSGNLGPWWAKALQDSGAKVALVDISNNRNLSTANFYQADITNIQQLHQLHRKITKDLGLVSILVNNAGIDAPPGAVVSNYNRMWKVNVQGLANCIEEFYSDMKKKKSGSIINIGSLYMERSPFEGLYSHKGFDKPWAYGATKAAVGQVTRHYATRLAKLGIRVNTLSPGGVFNNQDNEFVKKFSARVPLDRMADKEKDLAGPLIFLASDASSYITGINLQVNGGYTAW